MKTPRVFADFQNSDANGRVRLNTVGTAHDLAEQGVELREGLALMLYSDDVDADGGPDELIVGGIASYLNDERCWVATIDWNAIRHASELDTSPIAPVTFDDTPATSPPHVDRA